MPNPVSKSIAYFLSELSNTKVFNHDDSIKPAPSLSNCGKESQDGLSCLVKVG
jgi:hypothetical protein